MADKIQKGNIFVQKEENNLVIIDPNKVHTGGKTGAPVDRYVPQEDLVYFVNLEANPVPRSILDIGGNEETVRNVVAYGKVNYLGPNGGKPMDTSWTEDFSGKTNSKTAISDTKREYYTGNVDYDFQMENQYDTQLLGIKDIKIDTKPDNLKTSIITIRMVDVRGRALFDKGPSSIYSTFFHLPYPQFYLTVKGYYGEAITYQMVLSGQVKTSFESDGDYYVTASFMATNQKLLNDIRLKDAEVAPYLFEYVKPKTDADGEVKTCKSTKGFDILNQIYLNYGKDNLISEKLAKKPLTLPQLSKLVKRLDTFLEDDLMDEADISFFSDISEYGKVLSQLNTAVIEWFSKFCNVNNPIPIDDDKGGQYFEFKKAYQGGILKTKVGDKVTGSFNILENKEYNQSIYTIIDGYLKRLSEIKYFGKHQKLVLKTDEKGGMNEITYTSINTSKLNHSLLIYNFKKKQVRIDLFIDELEKVINTYTREYEQIKDQVEEVLSNVQNNYLGFEPTLKNVMGVILANTEAFLKVMKYTHDLSYKQRFNGDRKKGIDMKDNPDSVNDIVYPFPTIYDKNKEGRLEEYYPGDPAVKSKLKGYDTATWPEVKLVEEYLSAATTNGAISSEFCDTATTDKTSKVSDKVRYGVLTKDLTDNEGAFNESSFSGLIYRLYNRAIYSVLGTGFSKKTIDVIGYEDANNGKYSVNRLLNGKNLFKEGVTNLNALFGGGYLGKDIQLIETAKSLILTKSTEKDIEDRNSFTVIDTIADETVVKISPFANAGDVLMEEVKKYETHGLEPYPYTNDEWCKDNLKINKTNKFNRKVSTTYAESLRYTVSNSNKDVTKEDLFLSSDINPLQTPNFVTTDSDISKAYWLLNTIPTKSMTDIYEGEDSLKQNYFARFLGGDIKEVSNVQLLKWGSMWYRYTHQLETNEDILDNVWGDLDISGYSQNLYDIKGNSNGVDTFFNYDITSENISLGFYPELIIDKLNRVINDVEFKVDKIQEYINSGKLVIKKIGNIITTEELDKQSIDLYRCYYITEEGIIRLPSYSGPITPISKNEIPVLVNRSVSEDWDGQFDKGVFKDLPFSTVSRPKTDEHVINSEGTLSYGHIESIVSLFSYETLEKFKTMFMDFAKRKSDNNVGSYENFYYELLKSDTELEESFVKNNIENISKNKGLIDVIKISFDKAIDVKLSVLSSYVDSFVKEPIKFAEFKTIAMDDNLFFKINGSVSSEFVNGVRKSFFELSDIAPTEQNFKDFKGIINVWAEWRLSNLDGDIDGFKSSLLPTLTGFIGKIDGYVDNIFKNFSELINAEDGNSALEKSASDISGVELQKITYRILKNINDTWIGGFDWDKANLAKLFKYLNYLNEPIGDKFLMDVRVLNKYFNESNKGKPIASFISMILKDNALSEPMSFASNVNFYGNLTNSAENIKDAQKLANDVFGTHTTVNKNGLPGFVVFFRSNESEYLNIKKPNFKYGSDGFDIAVKNPISDKPTDVKQLREGNRGVAFNVDFGIQNQNMFTDFSIESYDGVKSGEELIVTENIANMRKGTTASSISTNLLDVMKTRVYQCSIKMMGNAMIQPFMYFNLRYIPIYSGTYFILSVEHTLSPDSGMITTFKGVRISKASVSNIDKGMVKARRNLLDNLIEKLVTKKRATELTKPNVYGGDTENQGNTGVKQTADVGCVVSNYWTNNGKNPIPKYDIPDSPTRLTDSELKGLIETAAGQLPNYGNTVKNGLMAMTFTVSKREQGRGNGVRFLYDNPFGLHLDGGGQSTFREEIKGYFCPSTSDGYARSTAIFHDVSKKEKVEDGIVNAYKAFMKSMKKRGETYYGVNHWESENSSNPEYLASLWAFYWNTSYKAIKDEGDTKGNLISEYENGKVSYKNGTNKDYSGEFDTFTKYNATFNKL